jgi:CheY-like chemotaxis protein
MPNGGKLTIETGNVQLDEDFAARHVDVNPGQYVELAVSDTGTGMSPEVQEQVFDPFFTTKEVGRGSGLGLSMVYGFLKQSGGHVKVVSEEGKGTTIRLFLPRALAASSEVGTEEVENPQPLGMGELILVVEDEQYVRRMVGAMLSGLGYRVLEAENAAEALALFEAHPEIRLLFTDVGLPGEMNGLELAEELGRRRPGTPVLFTSGYSEDVLMHRGRLDPCVHLLEKPFSKPDLARMIRLLLERS